MKTFCFKCEKTVDWTGEGVATCERDDCPLDPTATSSYDKKHLIGNWEPEEQELKQVDAPDTPEIKLRRNRLKSLWVRVRPFVSRVLPDRGILGVVKRVIAPIQRQATGDNRMIWLAIVFILFFIIFMLV